VTGRESCLHPKKKSFFLIPMPLESRLTSPMQRLPSPFPFSHGSPHPLLIKRSFLFVSALYIHHIFHLR
jgi:hypothetical protein